MRRNSRLLVLAPLILLFAHPALAAWPNQSAVNLPICRLVGDQFGSMLVPDGSGGAIIVWQDTRSGTIGSVLTASVLAVNGLGAWMLLALGGGVAGDGEKIDVAGLAMVAQPTDEMANAGPLLIVEDVLKALEKIGGVRIGRRDKPDAQGNIVENFVYEIRRPG